jgi:chorismate mutase/prephenate dehydratase
MELESNRKKIDEIDQEIVKLLDRRVSVCKEIGQKKVHHQVSIFDSAREKVVLEKVASAAHQAPADDVKSIYREIISMCRNVQRPTSVAYLGPEGTFAHEAASTAFGSSSKYISCRKISEVFSRVDRGDAELGVVPLENSLEGPINETLDQLMEYQLSIVGEIQLRIDQNLIVDQRIESLSQVEHLYSHPQALAQCDNYITKYLSHVDVVITESTARAVEHVLQDRNGAAIGSKVAAALNELKVFASGIEDHPNNFTRFIVLRRGPPPTCGEKTSILFSVDNTPGAVTAVLSELAKYKINITMILSRPTEQKPWEYFFFIDLEGSLGEERCLTALKAAKEKARLLRVLGSYSRLL